MDPIAPVAREPLDEQLARQLRARIYSADPAGGDRIDSAAVVARAAGMSEAMAMRAFDLLRREGLIRTDQGRGSYVLPRHRWHAVVSCAPAGRRPAGRTLAEVERAEPAVTGLELASDGAAWAWTMTVEAADAGHAAVVAVAAARAAGAGVAGWRLAVELAPAAE